MLAGVLQIALILHLYCDLLQEVFGEEDSAGVLAGILQIALPLLISKLVIVQLLKQQILCVFFTLRWARDKCSVSRQRQRDNMLGHLSHAKKRAILFNSKRSCHTHGVVILIRKQAKKIRP